MACLGGCVADLKKVHAPDLLTVTEREARKARPGRPWLDEGPSHPIYQVHSSLVPLQALTDGDETTAASAADPSRKGQYILIDLGCMTSVKQIVQAHGTASGFPRRYRIDAAGDHNFPYTLVWTGCGSESLSIAALRRPIRCRFLRLTLLETHEAPWSVCELWVR